MKSSKPLAGSKLVICRGEGDHGGGLAQLGHLPSRAQRRGGEVGPLARLEHHRADLSVGTGLFDHADEVVP